MIEYIDKFIDDECFFIFILNSNERCKIKKFNNKFGCSFDYCIGKIDTYTNWNNEQREATTISRNTNHFTTKRIIVIQIK